MLDARTGATPSAPTREDFTILAARLSRILGACELETLDAAVEECLEQLGRSAGADIAFVLLVDDEDRVADDWCWIGVDRRVTRPAPGSALRDTFGSSTEFLRLGYTVAIDDLAAIDLAPSERALAESNGLNAILFAPVRVGPTLLGLTGLQVLDHPHHWDRTAIGRVELLAEMLVKAVVRTRDRGTLAMADARARRIAEFLPDGLVLLDLNGAVTFASPSFGRASGLAASDIAGHQLAEHVHPDDCQLLAERMAENERFGSGLVVRMRASADWCWSELSWQLVHEPDSGVPDEIVVSIRDIHDKYLESESLARHHERDPLTGLLDRRGLDRAIAQLAESGASISLAFVDVDRFKKVNDTLGHSVGDEVLRLVGSALISAVRRGDIVARIGGDEFCVVAGAAGELPEAPATLGERLACAVELQLADQPGAVTVSIGLAGPAPAAAAGELRTRADAAMYRSKRAGRRFAVASE